MRFDSLCIKNLGVFAGEHSFKLSSPQTSDHPIQPALTVIRGQNGSGKSTLFQSCALALYGDRAVREFGEGQSYQAFLRQRLHRHGSSPAPQSGVELRFHLVRAGESLAIEVSRRFLLHGSKVAETLTVRQNGVVPNIDPSAYQHWLLDLVPPYLFGLCFFDAERMETLASPDHYHALLRRLTDPLTGIERVEGLIKEMRYYASKTSRGALGKSLERAYDECSTQRARLDLQVAHLQAEEKDVEAKRRLREAAIGDQEQVIASAGGAYVARKPWIVERLSQIKHEKAALIAELEIWAEGLFPFVLAPELLLALDKQLRLEEAYEQKQTVANMQQEVVMQVECRMQQEEWWQALPISPTLREPLSQQLTQALRSTFPPLTPVPERIVHGNVSAAEREQLRQWIAEARHVPRQISPLFDRIEKVWGEERSLKEELKRIPDEGILQPLYEDLRRLQKEQTRVLRRQVQLRDQIQALTYQKQLLERKLVDLEEQVEVEQAKETQLALATNCISALISYKSAARARYLACLERTLVSCFNVLCRKDLLLSRAQISEDYVVRLYGRDGDPIDTAAFSAGERQLYALSILWALRQTSRRQLPLLIDTPLARLDLGHRDRFVEAYLPNVSEQSVLFVTDAEADDHFLCKLGPALTHLYSLSFDPSSGQSLVHCEAGRVWEESAGSVQH